MKFALANKTNRLLERGLAFDLYDEIIDTDSVPPSLVSLPSVSDLAVMAKKSSQIYPRYRSCRNERLGTASVLVDNRHQLQHFHRCRFP